MVLTITGDGVSTEKKYTLKQLQDKKQYQQVYSAINTWPSKKWYVGKGVKLKDLLDGGRNEEQRQADYIYRERRLP